MKVAVIGANGGVGSLVVERSLNKNFDVTEIVRSADKAKTENYLIRDVYDLTSDDIKDFDVVVDALGFFGKNAPEYTPTTKHLLNIFSGLKTRLIVVGGAGSLFVNKEHTKKLSDSFPDEPWRVTPIEMGKALDIIKKSKDVNWTYISPAAEFLREGTKKDEYVIAGEEFTTDENGKSQLSYADYATALVEEIENNKFNKQRISVRW